MAIKDIDKICRSLISYLDEKGIQFSRVSREELEEKAVAEFSFDMRVPPSILCGQFKDSIKEIISIAHEVGHVMTYKKMSRDKARIYLCSMFAAHGIGLDEISASGREFILQVEADASAQGLVLLKGMGLDGGDLEVVAKLLAQWFSTYEEACNEEVVKKVRERIISYETTAWLVS
jgi:hypothetical protein